MVLRFRGLVLHGLGASGARFSTLGFGSSDGS